MKMKVYKSPNGLFFFSRKKHSPLWKQIYSYIHKEKRYEQDFEQHYRCDHYT